MVIKKPVGVLTNFQPTARARREVSFQLCFSSEGTRAPSPSQGDVSGPSTEAGDSIKVSVLSSTADVLVSVVVTAE